MIHIEKYQLSCSCRRTGCAHLLGIFFLLTQSSSPLAAQHCYGVKIQTAYEGERFQ